LHLEISTEKSRDFGGLLLGVGGATGSTGGVRGRIGWQFGAPDWLLYSLTLDTDFQHRVIVAPLVEAASPMIVIVPSLGFGLGVPVQVAPETRVGARLQFDLHFAPIGFVTSVDIYPSKGSSPGYTQATFLFEVGL
jgi:hypothetical protein